MSIPLVGQTVTQIGETIQQINGATVNAVLIFALLVALGALGLVAVLIKYVIPAIIGLQKSGAELAVASSGIVTQSAVIASKLEQNNQHTEKTLRVSEELSKVALNTSIEVNSTASKIDTIDSKITQITTDLGRALTEIDTLKTAIQSNTTTGGELKAKLDALQLQTTSILTELREIKSDLATVTAPPQSTAADTRIDDIEPKG